MGTKDDAAEKDGYEVLVPEVQDETKRKPKAGSEKKPPSAKSVRKHRVDNINRNMLAQALDAIAAEGRVVIALNISRDIGGLYEVVSWKDEPVH
jgi:hypothetical protein